MFLTPIEASIVTSPRFDFAASVRSAVWVVLSRAISNRTGVSRRQCSLGVLAAVGLALGCSAGGSEGNAPAVTPPGSVETPTPVPVDDSRAPMTPDLAPSGSDGTIFDPDDMGMSGAAMTPPRRRGLLERQVSCDGAASTTISGTVYIPSGALPIYNAVVYVPDGELQPLPEGVSCSCEISGEPIATTLTDSAGRFVLSNVPVGDDIPIVVQVGDWRREFNVGTVSACVDNPVPDQTLRLPARQSEGDMPRIAVVTGATDALECLVRKLGIDPTEFTTPIGSGRVQLFAGDGGTERYTESWGDGLVFPPGDALWWDLPSLEPFDVVLLSCDGVVPSSRDLRPESLQAMHDYLNRGGRVFGSHYQEAWLQQGPGELSELASYVDEDSDDDLGTVNAQVITSFPKGQALAEWLFNVGASPTLGELEIRGTQHSIGQENPEYAQRWISTENPDSVQYISANTPLGVPEEQQCGRLVLSDIHVSPGSAGDDRSAIELPFPSGCVTEEFTPQEAVLAFMLFDISACIVPDDQAPVAPPSIR